MTPDSATAEFLYQALSIDEAVRPVFEQVRAFPQQQHFEDDAARALIDISRTFARFFIILAVTLSVGYTGYGAWLLMASGGESQKLDQSRDVLRNVLVGLTLSICSYLIISIAVSVVISTVGLPETVSFWSPETFDDEFGIGSLLDGKEYALQGEVLLLENGGPIICDEILEKTARDKGWVWISNIEGTGLGGCLK